MLTGQDTHPENHDKTVEMVDNLCEALRTIRVSTGLGKGGVNWSVALQSDYVVGERSYWALVATLEGYG